MHSHDSTYQSCVPARACTHTNIRMCMLATCHVGSMKARTTRVMHTMNTNLLRHLYIIFNWHKPKTQNSTYKHPLMGGGCSLDQVHQIQIKNTSTTSRRGPTKQTADSKRTQRNSTQNNLRLAYYLTNNFTTCTYPSSTSTCRSTYTGILHCNKWSQATTYVLVISTQSKWS